MTQTAVPSPPQWIARAISGIAELPSRIVTAIEDWRERDILQREFAELGARGELDRVLEDAGMSRCDISILLKNGFVVRRQLGHMFERLGVNLDRRLPTVTMREIHWRCMRCDSRRRCQEWLTSGMSDNAFRGFKDRGVHRTS